MKRILAHSERDAQKRRDAFAERYKVYSGNGYDLDRIKKEVNKELDLKFLRYYLGESNKFKNEPNPIVSFRDGKLQFAEQGLRAAMKKKGADPELLKMEIAEMSFCEDVGNGSLYFKRKDVMKQVCTITYDCIQMEIERTYVAGSPYSEYVITPAKEIPWRTSSGGYYKFVLDPTEQEFYFLDLATLLMDLAFEYRLRQEEIAYHAKQLRILAMEVAVVDEEHIPLEPIDDATIESIIAECHSKGLDGDNTFKAIVRPWMDAISDYLRHMTDKYDDRVLICNLGVEPESTPSPLGAIFGSATCIYGRGRGSDWVKIAPRTTFMELCEEKQVVGEYIIPAPTFLRDPGRQHTIASFKVGDSETIIDEMIYTSSFLKDTLTILPNAKERRFQLDINGSIGIHALVGYLKQMPTLCEKMNELAARIDAKL